MRESTGSRRGRRRERRATRRPDPGPDPVRFFPDPVLFFPGLLSSSPPDAEIDRVLRVRDDAYAVLRASRATPPADLRHNYRRLALLVHPDRCRHPGATEAAAAVNRSHAILGDPLKRKLYDACVGDSGAGGTGADWEDAAAAAASLPRWMQRLLLAPGGACCALLLLALLLVPALALALMVAILCLPLRVVGLAMAACGRCCRPRAAAAGDVEAPPPAPAAEGTARERAEARAAARAAAAAEEVPPVIVLGPG